MTDTAHTAGFVGCSACRDTGYVQAPSTNAWRLYFKRTGQGHLNVLVPCRACGGNDGRQNRLALLARLSALKASRAKASGETP